MIILYVPFPRNQAGDLTASMDSWVKNHTQNFGNTIQVIFYQDEIDYDAIPPYASIYLCAHGSSDAELKLYNNRNLAISNSISIEETARRLSNEFVFIHYKIQDIHLYCCGSQEKNYQLAKLIQGNLPDIQENRIHYYRGSLMSANQSGQLFSMIDTNFLPAEQAKFTLPSIKTQDKDEQDSVPRFYRFYLSKHRPYSNYFNEERQEKKRQHFFEGCRERRKQGELEKRRGLMDVVEIMTDTITPRPG